MVIEVSITIFITTYRFKHSFMTTYQKFQGGLLETHRKHLLAFASGTFLNVLILAQFKHHSFAKQVMIANFIDVRSELQFKYLSFETADVMAAD